jgi:hypothetical protein
MAQTDANIVVDHGQSRWSDLWTKEDYLAIWLGFLIIAVSLTAYFIFGPRAEFATKIEAANQIQSAEAAKAPFKTIAWYKAEADKKKLKGSSTAYGKFVTHWTKTPGKWKDNPVDSLIRSESQAKAMNDKAMPAFEEAQGKAAAALASAQQAEEAAAIAAFKDPALNAAAGAKSKTGRPPRRKPMPPRPKPLINRTTIFRPLSACAPSLS